jgi:hypothetical protein
LSFSSSSTLPPGMSIASLFYVLLGCPSVFLGTMADPREVNRVRSPHMFRSSSSSIRHSCQLTPPACSPRLSSQRASLRTSCNLCPRLAEPYFLLVRG